MLHLIFALAVAADSDELAKAVRAVAAADGYRFTVSETTGAPTTDGVYQKGAPLFVRADRMEFFRKGDVMVYKQGDGWHRTRTGTLSDPLAILGASAKVRAVRLPHEELERLGKALANGKRVEADGAVTITGDLTAEVARELARTEDRDLTRGGTATVRLDRTGRVVGYEIAIRVQGTRGNADVDGTVTKAVTVSDVGSTKVEVPAAAKKALE